MAKKIEINENWEPVEVEDLDNLFVVIFKRGSFDQGYVESFDTDDVLMQSAYDSLTKQYDDCGCDEQTKIYLIKVPNTDQTQSMCNTGLFNGNSCDPHIIEATRDLFNRADCEHLSCWEGCGLTEAKKKKKPYSSAYCGFTDPELNIKHFNKCMGTSGLQNPDAPHLVVGDTLPNPPAISDNASGAASSGGESCAIGESLEEAVNYYDQVEKMRALENGTRGFNAKAASDEKLRVNRQVCIDKGFYKALKIVEDEMISRGLINQRYSPKISVKISDYKLKPDMFILGSAKIIWAERNNPQQLIKDYGNSLEDLLIILVFALWMKEAVLADAIKDHIITKFTVTITELKDYLNQLFANKTLIIAVKQVIQECCTESLTEDSAYSHKMMDKFELPPQIKLLNQNQVEDFIKQLSPEELFRVGYATPLYFYSELDDKFDLVKATEMEGYTGLDYRDAVADQSVADHADRIANAQRQIDTYADVLDKNQGHKLNKSGERFSTTYRATNKLALNPEKPNEYIEYELDDEGKPRLDDKGEKVIKSKIDMNKILFYPRVGSQPITHYYVDFHNGQGFKPIRREVLVDTLYKFIEELEKAADRGVSKADLTWLKKKGYKNVDKDSVGAIKAFYDATPGEMPIWVYRKAEEAGIAPEDYYKEHPYSTRWSMSDFRKKAKSLFDADARTIMAQDAATVSGQELAAVKGMDRTVSRSEAKPQVRALYSNQVYYLDGKPGTFGAMLKEGLEEEISLDEAKRYVKRYYVRPLNIFCGNKEDIIQALIRAGDQNCSVYSLKRLDDHEDVHLLQPSDIIYYYDDHVLYDKNHVQVMDYDLFVKHEEDRKKVGNVDALSDTTFSDMYDDRATEDDLKDKEVIANYKALNSISR